MPVDSELACWVPTVFHGNRRAVPSGVPDTLTHSAGEVTARWDRLTYGAELDPPIDQATVEAARAVESRFKIGYWDALILAAAQQQGCELLLSEALQHEQRYDGVQVLNPFLVGPERLAA